MRVWADAPARSRDTLLARSKTSPAPSQGTALRGGRASRCRGLLAEAPYPSMAQRARVPAEQTPARCALLRIGTRRLRPARLRRSKATKGPHPRRRPRGRRVEAPLKTAQARAAVLRRRPARAAMEPIPCPRPEGADAQSAQAAARAVRQSASLGSQPCLWRRDVVRGEHELSDVGRRGAFFTRRPA